MQQTLKGLLYNPTAGKFVAAAIAVIVILTISGFVQRSIGRYIKATATRYRARKFVSLTGYVVAIFAINRLQR